MQPFSRDTVGCGLSLCNEVVGPETAADASLRIRACQVSHRSPPTMHRHMAGGITRLTLPSTRLLVVSFQEPAPMPEGQNKRDVAKPASPSCPKGQALRGDADRLGVQRRPCLADAPLVPRWATGHHTETEHDQVLVRLQRTTGHCKLGGGPEGPQMHLCSAILRPCARIIVWSAHAIF